MVAECEVIFTKRCDKAFQLNKRAYRNSSVRRVGKALTNSRAAHPIIFNRVDHNA